MARAKTKTESTTASPFTAFDALMATAAVDSQIQALADSGADTPTLDAALTEATQAAQRRWGLGLHHLKHAARTDGDDIVFLTGDRPAATLSQGVEALARAYEDMRASDERGLSLWGASARATACPATRPAPA